MIVERTRALGLAGRVTISHAFCIAALAPPAFDVLARDLAEQRIALTTIAPGAREPLPLRRLRDVGVVVGLGQDGIRDLWSPYGSGDMLERSMLLAWRSGFRRDEDLGLALDAATGGGAHVLGLDHYGLDIGCQADLVLVRSQPLRKRWSRIRRGRSWSSVAWSSEARDSQARSRGP